MTFIDLDLVKRSVRADDFSDDDQHLEFLTEAATEFITRRVNRDIEELVDPDGHLPAPLVQAILLVVGHWYNQREAVASVAMTEVPVGVDALVRQYQRLVL